MTFESERWTMDPRRQQLLTEILDTPLSTSTGEKTMSLRQAMHEDRALLHDLETAFTGAQGPDEGPSPEAMAADELAAGDQVGPYRIDRVLGRGGMGVVYLATRTDDFEQRVALKLVGSGQRSAEILDRFYKERQILADLQHPHVARLLDGGSTGDAWPYLVMEYVDGEPIDAYCDARDLSLRERLELFLKVCGAVQFAHQSLVVHRDLKPGNILVTPDGEPKLLDFGIAKILRPDPLAEDWDLVTAPTHQPMTPAFASPEQFAGKPVTTVSDVYSLGVLLYWLTSGRPPYRLKGLAPTEVIRLVCLEEPPPPSVAARSSKPGGVEGRRRAKRLTGDIDAIVLQAMRKDPGSRYSSAAQLAEDIRRHLDGLPVAAHRGTWLYHAGKLARRYKLALVILLMIVAFAVVSAVLWRQAESARGRAEAAAERAEDERTRAVTERARATNVAGFLEDIFTAADPDSTRGAEVPVREILDRAQEKIAVSLGESPEHRADMLGTLGTVYNNLGLFETARDLKEEALTLRRQADPSDRPELAIDINNLARLHFDLGDPATAEPLFREALAISQRLGDEQRSEVAMLNLAGVLTHLGAVDEAVDLHRQVLQRRTERHGPEDIRVASGLFGLGIAYFTRGDLELAESQLRQALALYLAAHGSEHSRVASVKGNLGLVLHARRQLPQAQVFFEQSLETRRRLLGDGHASVATVRKNLAALLLDAGEVETSGRLLRQALDSLRRQKPQGDWVLAHAECVWGSYLAAVGNPQEAEPFIRSGLETLASKRGERDIFTRDASRRLARLVDSRSGRK